ncbi:MAG: hypothetical protein D6760_02810 [Deltaproteobacteria bacterium]|nr:MAG: hypothetical protein D6760_02810 [Deltaproteobacteria bacterium]
MEKEVLAHRNVICIRDAALIQSAVRHERRARLAEQWLRRKWGTLSTADKLAILREASAATDSRDKCIERLALPRPKDVDPWDELYRRPLIAADDATAASREAESDDPKPPGLTGSSDGRETA